MTGGTVYWITGLSGAGKTTIGKALFTHLREIKRGVVFLDGDTMREVFGSRFGYDENDRRMLAMQYARLCKMLADQGLDVVCATMSLFDACRDWNRGNIGKYIEVYVRVPIDELKRRDQKGLYSRGNQGVIGIDFPFEEPKTPDIVIDNGGKPDVEMVCSEILAYMNLAHL